MRSPNYEALDRIGTGRPFFERTSGITERRQVDIGRPAPGQRRQRPARTPRDRELEALALRRRQLALLALYR